MILQNDSFLVSKRFSNPTAFLVGENDAAKVVVDGVIIVKPSMVLAMSSVYRP
jgi:hypothetical protein